MDELMKLHLRQTELIRERYDPLKFLFDAPKKFFTFGLYNHKKEKAMDLELDDLHIKIMNILRGKIKNES